MPEALLCETCGGELILSVGHFAGRHFFYCYAGYGAGVGGASLKHDVFEAGAGKPASKLFCIFFCAEGAKLDVPIGAGGEVRGFFRGLCSRRGF